MRKFFLLVSTMLLVLVNGQNVGVNTNYPKTIFHVDAKKDNILVPTATENSDDFVVTNNGNVMVGGINPKVKFEIESGVTNSSGLRFRNLTTSSPASSVPAGSTATFLGVDNDGNVIVSGRDEPRIVTTIEDNISNYDGVVRNNDGTINSKLLPFSFVKTNTTPVPYLPTIIVPGSEVEFTIPSGKPRAVFMNFMMSFGLTFTGDSGTNGSEVFGAEIVIENKSVTPSVITNTEVSQITQLQSPMPTRQMFAVNYVTNLSAGDYVAKIRIVTKRFLFSSATIATVKTVFFNPIQYSYNISFFES